MPELHAVKKRSAGDFTTFVDAAGDHHFVAGVRLNNSAQIHARAATGRLASYLCDSDLIRRIEDPVTPPAKFALPYAGFRVSEAQKRFFKLM